jgi:hypothetical protein
MRAVRLKSAIYASDKPLGSLEYGVRQPSKRGLAVPFSVAVFRVARFRTHRQ